MKLEHLYTERADDYRFVRVAGPDGKRYVATFYKNKAGNVEGFYFMGRTKRLSSASGIGYKVSTFASQYI